MNDNDGQINMINWIEIMKEREERRETGRKACDAITGKWKKGQKDNIEMNKTKKRRVVAII